MNKQILIGHLARKPEVEYTTTGTAVCKFSVAVNSHSKKEPHTEWFNIVTFGRMAENCGAYLVKGAQVYIEGQTKTDKWTDKDGNKKQRTSVIAEDVQFLSNKVALDEH